MVTCTPSDYICLNWTRNYTEHKRAGPLSFGAFSNCHSWKVTDGTPHLLTLLQSFASALGPSLTELPTIQCNTRGGGLATVEKFEPWAIRGFRRHHDGGLHAGEKQTREQGDAMKKEERPADGKEIRFPYNLLPGAK